MPELVLLILIFLGAGMVVLASNLFLGRMLRPDRPSPEKGEVYECGEHPIGSAWVQFDVRFYVVALLFVVFDVELAFFFPWAVVFGSATRAGDESLPVAQRIEAAKQIQPPAEHVSLQPKPVDAPGRIRPQEPNPKAAATPEGEPDAAGMRKLARVAFLDLLVFFGVLLVGFAYLWRRGDLAWVRSLAGQAANHKSTKPVGAEPQAIVSGR